MEPDDVELTDGVFALLHRTIGSRDNVFEGEVRSLVYGVRPCVVKFARIPEQNIREAEILTRLGSHTNVIAIIQSGTYHDVFGDRVYIALDKCHDENLRQYLANGKSAGINFDLDQAVCYAKQVIDGVMYIHEHNVIHLDLKPSNILISQNFQLIKIADFGLSVVVKSPKSKMFHKGQFGTNGYRPIESFGNGEISQRTDIFSLGAVLLHLLTNGNDVFGCDDHIFVYNVMNDITNTSGLLVHNPTTTEHLIKRMVSQERRRRPTIWQVSDHPCWSGMEVECVFEYSTEDEIDDKTIDGRKEDHEIASRSSIPDDREFLRKMREMGFNRQTMMLLFDGQSAHLRRLNLRNGEMQRMHPIAEQLTAPYFTAVVFGEYVYAFNNDRSVYRLEYCDAKASWERMSDCTDYHGHEPAYSVSYSNAVFWVGASYGFFADEAIRTVSRYFPSEDRWERLNDKPTATYLSAIFCNDETLYCVGGHSETGQVVNIIEKLDLKTMTWEMIDNIKQQKIPAVEGIVEHRGSLYFVASDPQTINIGIYDPDVNELTLLKHLKGRFTPSTMRAFAVNGDMFVVSGDGYIYPYDFAKNEFTRTLSYYSKMFFVEAVLVKMSA